ETFGEDPYLAGRIAAAEIRGIQRRHVIAQVKHFAANNQEIQRFGNPLGSPALSPAIDVVVSDRALEEIYFPAFKMAVQVGRAASVMCAYPRINGLYACQNPALLGTLKGAWGFPGFVGPDAILAVRDTLAAVAAGTDNFQLGVVGASPPQVLAQVADARLDDMVRRILTAMASVGLLDHPPTGRPDAVVGGPVVTPLAGIAARAGKGVTVTHADGTLGVVPLPTVPADVLGPSSGSGPGLFGTYYATMDWSGSPLAAFVTPTIDSDGVLPPGAHSARWTGTLVPQRSGRHRFALRHAGVARLYVDGQLVASGDSEGLDALMPGAPPVTAQGTAMLTAGTPVPIVLEYSLGSSVAGARLHLGWQPPDPALLAQAVAAARAADAAIVFVNDVTSEGMDRTALALPGDQDDL